MIVRLFDIQTFTTIGLTTSLTNTLTTPAFIEGKRSGSSGYLVSDTSSGSNSLTLYQVSGRFLENEPFKINGIDNSRLINSVTDYSIRDVKSLYSLTGISTFNADVVLSKKSYIIWPLSVTLQPIGMPSLNLKFAIDFFAYVSTAFCPAI